MTVGAIAALVVVFFMRVGDYAENFTTARARRAVKDLTAMAPQTARVEREGGEVELPVAEVQVGDVVIVRPGEKIPVDGEVVDGQTTVDQATITGEAMPVEAGPGAHVFAATIARLGSLRLRTTCVGADTTFGRVVKLNIAFTALYNLVGLTLAAFGILPPILAAAQSLPDLGILANSSQLLWQR